MMLLWLFIPLGLVLVLVGLMLALSPGRLKPFTDENGKVIAGSISEKTRVKINGVQQGMIIEGKDIANPVLLFLHGGTGMPEYFFTRRYPTGLERYFTVCWWDRRGAGLSYAAGAPQDAITLDQLISDTLEVTNYLRGRFHKEKIYLMAHSGGSLIGIQAAARAPEFYFAYIGMAQMAYQLRAESLDYEYMLDRYRELGNTKMVRQLEAAAPAMTAPLPPSYMSVRDKAMHDLGVGTTHDMKSVVTGVILQSWLCREYTISEKIHLWRGKFLCDRLLWDKMITADLTRLVPELGLPAYFFHGKYDYTVAYPETRSYFEKLRAPLKGFYTFERSAHSPMFEEPAKMQRILQEDVLKATNTLADKQ